MHPLSRLRRQLPLQGSLWGGCRPIKPPLQGEVDAPQAQTEGCGALPRKYLSGSPEAADRRMPLRRGGPMIFVCPQGLRWRKVHGTMQASSPTQHGSRLCRILQDTPRAKRQCTPQSASPPAPLAGEPLGRLPPRKASPARGGGCAAGADGGVRRLAPQISFRVRRTPLRRGADDFRLPASKVRRCKHRPLRSTDRGSAGFCRTLPAQSGNAPLSRLRRQLPLQGRFKGARWKQA